VRRRPVGSRLGWVADFESHRRTGIHESATVIGVASTLWTSQKAPPHASPSKEHACSQGKYYASVSREYHRRRPSCCNRGGPVPMVSLLSSPLIRAACPRPIVVRAARSMKQAVAHPAPPLWCLHSPWSLEVPGRSTLLKAARDARPPPSKCQRDWSAARVLTLIKEQHQQAAGMNMRHLCRSRARGINRSTPMLMRMSVILRGRPDCRQMDHCARD